MQIGDSGPPKETPNPAVKRISLGPTDRDVALAHVEKEKSLSFIKAWEESDKSKGPKRSLLLYLRGKKPRKRLLKLN
ncbi:hypothetical protein Vadar_021448 [Vaccinium darrowii]|uniref:Uncharacterized protein n=1 Tax=Vaccinium darrowii TaxID=229202 RepID=A0ACB7ZDQ6_9ERIC|nr:hypothetical protein Vadar_021448 [Vaccinium darrowii]